MDIANNVGESRKYMSSLDLCFILITQLLYSVTTSTTHKHPTSNAVVDISFHFFYCYDAFFQYFWFELIFNHNHTICCFSLFVCGGGQPTSSCRQHHTFLNLKIFPFLIFSLFSRLLQISNYFI